MHSYSSLLDDLTRLGIRSDDRLLVHSSMKAVGAVENGVDTVLDALSHQVCNGMLLMPTHTWKDTNNPGGVFDPIREPSCVGILTERFRNRPGAKRSWHPTHSIAGLGQAVTEFLDGEALTRTPCPRTGCWGRLYDVDARILFLGASLRTNTFLHSVEEWHDIPDRLATRATEYRIRKPDGTGFIECPQFGHFSSFGDVSQNFDKVEAELLSLGIAREGPIGDARSVLCNVRLMAYLVSRHLIREPQYFARGS